MTPQDRAYQVYCDIARTALNREPISRERWDAIPARSYFRSCAVDRHDDCDFDYVKDREGDAQ